MSESKFAQFCVERNLVHSNYYSDTYRDEFNLNNYSQNWDIHHIHLPFNKNREEAFMARFHISEAEMKAFYSSFSARIKNHVKITQQIEQSQNTRTIRSSIQAASRELVQDHDAGTADIYIVTEPAHPLVGSEIFSRKNNFVSDFAFLGLRLLQSVKDYNSAGIHIGTFDLDSMYITKSDDGKSIIKDGYFIYASNENELETAMPCGPDAAAFMAESVLTGKELPSFTGDVAAVCALLWTLFSGNYYTEKPDLNTPPKYITAEMTELLKRGIAKEEGAYKDISVGLRDFYNQLKAGTVPNEFIIFEPPAYTRMALTVPTEQPKPEPPEEPQKHSRSFSFFKKKEQPTTEEEPEVTYHDKDEDDDDDDEPQQEESGEEKTVPLWKKVVMGFLVFLVVLFSLLLLTMVVMALWFPDIDVFSVLSTKKQPPIAIASSSPVVTTMPSPTPEPTPTRTPTPTPSPSPTPAPEAPSLILDYDWKWYAAEEKPENIGSIEFTTSTELTPDEKGIVTAWAPAEGIGCYLITNELAKAKGYTAEPLNGKYTLIISGNKADKIKTNFNQVEALTYFSDRMGQVIVKGYEIIQVAPELIQEAPSPSPTATPTPAAPQKQSTYTYGSSGGSTSGYTSGSSSTSTQSAPVPVPVQVAPEPFTVSPTNITLQLGGTYPLKPSYSCTYYFSCSGVCQVISGINGEPVIQAIGSGTCVISCQCSDPDAGSYNGSIATITVVVEGGEAAEPQIDPQPAWEPVPGSEEEIVPDIPGLNLG